MRASRLINILTSLQARGRATASELAEENEVDVRTIYRDIDALSASGVPVYSERGRDGGYRLLDGYRVRLNGLSPGEAQALFLAGLPGPAADLGLGALIESAERKLVVALPEGLRDSASFMRSRFLFDAPGWYDDAEQPAHLRAVVDAVMQSRRIAIRYRSWRAEKQRILEPLGVVMKGGQYYLAGGIDGAVRTYRIARILDLETLAETFDRPDGFDLAAYWAKSTERMEDDTHPLTITLKLTPRGLVFLKYWSTAYVRARMVVEGPLADGRSIVTMPAETIELAASGVLRLGQEVEAIEPPQLRRLVGDWAQGLADRHRSETA